MMKQWLVFTTESDAIAAEDAIRNYGSSVFASEGIPVDANGRVTDQSGKVLIDRFAKVVELSDGRFVINDPMTEDWLSSRWRRGELTREQADAGNAQIGQGGRDVVAVPFEVISVDRDLV